MDVHGRALWNDIERTIGMADLFHLAFLSGPILAIFADPEMAIFTGR
ncbi:MAG: hypothetical protein IKQ54_03965 [Oscillospiraceae bacterium]|nr:hypothetical protein [Oscillospiraceae bacterium]